MQDVSQSPWNRLRTAVRETWQTSSVRALVFFFFNIRKLVENLNLLDNTEVAFCSFGSLSRTAGPAIVRGLDKFISRNTYCTASVGSFTSPLS